MDHLMSSGAPPQEPAPGRGPTPEPGWQGGVPAPGWPAGQPAPLEAPGRRRHAAELESDPSVLTPAALMFGVRASVVPADLLAAFVLALTVAASGLITGALWAWIGPHVPVLMTSSGPILAEYYGESAFGSQVTFGALGLGIGTLLGPITYLLRRRRGPIVLVGLALGCLAAAWISWKVGAWVGRDHYKDLLQHAAAGRKFPMPVKLDATGLIFLEPLMAVLGYVVVAAWSRSADLGITGAPYRLPKHGSGSGE